MSLSPRQLAARMVCAGFHGTALTPELRELLDAGVGAVVLFARNVESPEQVAGLNAAIKHYAGRPILVCVDQEGGRVRRFREGFTEIPSMRQLGESNDPNLARQVGAVIARELRAVNVDLNFAPVLDVDTNPLNPVIADRSLARDADEVARLGVALVEGMQGEGVAACGKHFPGHGDTSQDSHHDLPRLPHSLDRLLDVELAPFEAAVQAGIASIMTSHVIFEAIDPVYPATMSRDVLVGLLRQRLGFNGLVISDDLEMKAVAANFAFDEILLRGVDAGIDLFCIAHSIEKQRQAIEVLAGAVKSGRLPQLRLERSVARVDGLTACFAHPPVGRERLDVLRSEGHLEVARQLAPNGNGRDPTVYQPA